MRFNNQNYPRSTYNSNCYQGYHNKHHKKYYHHQQEEGESNSASWRNQKHINNNLIIDNRDETLRHEDNTSRENKSNEVKPINNKSNNDNKRYYDDYKKIHNNSFEQNNHSNQYKTKLSHQYRNYNKKEILYQQFNQNQQFNSQFKQNPNGNNYNIEQSDNSLNQLSKRLFNPFYPYFNQNEQLFINSNNYNRNNSNLIYINCLNSNIKENINNSNHINYDQISHLNKNILNQINPLEFYPKKIAQKININNSYNNKSTNQNTLQTNSINSNSESWSSIQQTSPIKDNVISNNQSSFSSVSQSPKSEFLKYPYHSPIKQISNPKMPLVNHPLSNSPQLRYPMPSIPHHYNQLEYSPSLLNNYNMQCNYNQMNIPNPNTIDQKNVFYHNNQMSYFYHNRHNQNTTDNQLKKNHNPFKEIKRVKSDKNLLSIIDNNDNESMNISLKKCESESETEEETKEQSLFQTIKVQVLLPTKETKYFECGINENNIKISVEKFASDNNISNSNVITMLKYKIEEVIKTVSQILKYNLNLNEKENLFEIQNILNKDKKNQNEIKAMAKDDMSILAKSELRVNEHFESLFKEKSDYSKYISLNMTQ